MIRCIVILFYTGVLLHPLKPPRSRRERRGSDQTAVTGPGETYGESEHRLYIRDVLHPEEDLNLSRKTVQQPVQRELNSVSAYPKPKCSCKATKCEGQRSHKEAIASWYKTVQRTYNVAFGKRAVQSSTSVGNGDVSNPACAAVNGNTRPILCFEGSPSSYGCSNKRSEKNCILTAEDDYQPYWMVDLGQVFTVISMELFRREKSSQHKLEEVVWSWLAGLHVFVDAQLCCRFSDYKPGYDWPFARRHNTYQRFSGHVRCDKPIRGRHVRLEKAPYPFVDKRPRGFQKDFSQLQLQLQLQLCELQVWVCDLGTYADQDKQTCRKCDSSCKHPCDNYYGCYEPVPYNVAMLKNATQSATRNGGEAKYGVDGFGAILVNTPNNKRVETGPDPDTGETWWRVDLGGVFNISHIILTTAEGLSDFEIWVSRCIKCKEARHQPGIAMCLNFTGLPKNTVAKRLDCESTVTGRYVTLVMQEKDQQTSMSFSELQVMGVNATEVSPGPCQGLDCDSSPSPSKGDKKEETLSGGAKAAIAVSVAAPAFLGMCFVLRRFFNFCDLFSVPIVMPAKCFDSEDGEVEDSEQGSSSSGPEDGAV